MQLSDFNFTLPNELIAQEPKEPRDHSRLMIVDNLEIVEKLFYQITDFLKPGDVLCFNDSRVIKSKLVLTHEAKNIELYLIQPVEENIWKGFAKPYSKLTEGSVFNFGAEKVIILKKLGYGEILVKIELRKLDNIFAFFEAYGQMPLPPYIKRASNNFDNERYQTVYGNNSGSVAAPTAGLHFTQDLLNKIKKIGVEFEFVTLHVGAGTFLPIKVENIEDHFMHYEHVEISKDTAEKINIAQSQGRRIVAVGTTAVRALESSVKDGKLQSGSYDTNIFIKPGFDFKIVDLLITNLHLPKSTLLLLVSAFAGINSIKHAYEYAINNKFRFFSYGDAMLLSRKELIHAQ